MKKFLAVTLTCALLLAGLLACSGGGEAQKQVDLSAFAKSLQEKYEFAAYLMELDPEADEFAQQSIEQYLPGLLELDLAQRVIYMSMMRLNNGEFSLVQARSPGDAARATEIFQQRIDYMVETGAFYPGPVELWTNCSRIEANGNYVLLVCAEECDQIVDEFNALFG